MQLLGVKKDTARIDYNPAENNLLPSDFLLIEEGEQKIVAQVLCTYPTENNTRNIAEIKFALSIDEDENLSYYNGFLPSGDSIVIYVKPEEIIALMKDSETNIYFGNLSNHKECFVNTSLSILNEKLYIQSDRDDKTKILIQNIISELYSKKKKVIVIDFDGRYNSILNAERLTVTKDYKLPLDINAFDTILNEDSNFCTSEDKSTLENIVFELTNYISTLKDKYLPFSVFKTVIEELNNNDESGIKYLNKKLQEYLEQKIFAEDKKQFNLVTDKLLNNDVLIINASNLDDKWHKLLIDTIADYTEIQTYLAVSLNDSESDKDIIDKIFNSDKIIPIISSHYDNKNREVLKQLCKNYILLKPAQNIDDKETYTTLLNKLNPGDFILYGNSSLYMSLIIELQSFDNSTEQEVIQNEIKQDVDKFFSSENKPIAEEILVENNPPINENDITEEDLDFLDSEENKNNEENEENYGVFEPLNLTQENNVEDDDTQENNVENNDTKENEVENNDTEEISNMELKEDKNNIAIETVNEILQETIEQETFPILVEEDYDDTNENIKQADEITDNNTSIESAETNKTENPAETEIEENEITENKKNKTNNDAAKDYEKQKITVYETDNSTNNYSQNDIPFKVGDKVYHPKHGNGVIEGFANYSNKILFCQIEFENVGRRILDPRISGLEKIS